MSPQIFNRASRVTLKSRQSSESRKSLNYKRYTENPKNYDMISAYSQSFVQPVVSRGTILSKKLSCMSSGIGPIKARAL